MNPKIIAKNEWGQMTRNWAINQINYTIPWLVIMRMMRNYNLRQLCHKRSFIIIINIFISKSKYFQFLFVRIVVSHGFRDDHQKISLHSRSHKNPEDWNVSLWKTTDPKGWQYLKWPFAKKKSTWSPRKPEHSFHQVNLSPKWWCRLSTILLFDFQLALKPM